MDAPVELLVNAVVNGSKLRRATVNNGNCRTADGRDADVRFSSFFSADLDRCKNHGHGLMVS